MNGKDKCELLRNIRKTVAERYGLHYEPRECHHEGDCLGTCPMCDAEVADLQRQLEEKGIANVDISDKSILQEWDGFEEGTSMPVNSSDGSEDAERKIIVTQGLVPDFPEPLQGDVAPHGYMDECASECVIAETYIDGLELYNALEVWQDLYEGMELDLVRHCKSQYDDNAEALMVRLEKDGLLMTYVLGFLPKGEIKTVIAFMNMGWEDYFIVRITDIDEHKGKPLKIHVSISIRNRRYVKRITKDNMLRYMTISPEEYAETAESIRKKGTVYFRWRFFPPWKYGMPHEGERVLVICKDKEETTLHLMMVAATDTGCVPFVEGGIEEVELVDDCTAYVLVSLGREVTVPNTDMSEIIEYMQETRLPDLYLSDEDTERVYRTLEEPE